MPIDARIPLMVQPIQIDSPFDVAHKGMTLKNLARQDRLMQAQEEEAQQAKMVRRASQILATVRDQSSWEKAVAQARAEGLPGQDQHPLAYDPQYVQSLKMSLMPYEQQFKEREFAAGQYNKEQDRYLERQKLGLEKTKIDTTKAEKEAKAGKLTPAQAKQQGLYESGLKAESQYLAATKKEPGIKGWWNQYDPSSSLQWIDKNDWAPNFLKSSEAQAAKSAQRRWVEAFLRDASGAAIPENERDAYARDFFPVAGDSAQVVRDKAEARRQKMENARMAASGAVDHSQFSDVSNEDIDAEIARRQGTAGR